MTVGIPGKLRGSHHLQGTFLKERLWFRQLLNQVILVEMYQICQNLG